MCFSRKIGFAALLLGLCLLPACQTGNPVMDRQTARRINNMNETWAIAEKQEAIRPGKLQRVEQLARKELRKRQERFDSIPLNWMIWWAFI